MNHHSYPSIKSDASKTPLLAALMAVVAYAIFVVVRTVFAAKGNIAAFIVLGNSFVDRHALPIQHLPQVNGPGYDGQFYFRMSLDPFNLNEHAFGITFDTPYRPSRIGYPLIVFVLAAFDKALVPASLVYTNLLAVGAIAFLGAHMAKDAKISPFYGLLPAGYFGFTFSISRDLTEITGTVFVLAALYFMRRQRWKLATLAFSYSVITRETATLVVFAIGIYWLWCHRYVISPRFDRHKAPFPPYIWIVPAFVYAFWGVVTFLNVHQVGLKSDLAANLYFPLAAPIEALAERLSDINQLSSLLWLGQSASWATTQAVAAAQYRHSKATPWEKLAWLVTVLASLSLSSEIWGNTNYLRSVSLSWILAVVVLWGSKPSRRFIASISLVSWLISALPLLLFI
ncbi:hypothetical protein SAMN02745225_00237 [Ferrithrix thermotolerans DSM 19514]|uniref:Glycosyltransferase RgtA/B/C/D-like domain-containing protein n=1 Tax=Ferrithrix thermotolerans DSM 19514 TaxID=1121881 RepID=A0A1M4SER9_9ACTN|nr:hypothetical protein [Ferrithrix thermotolerans]SHE30507.1 hypothetical protein SAMN02745225_00237 [Ferrithrix thermotolerans DSM 19514]